MTILMIIIGIIMFMALIILHELGHFRAAKKTGVKVKEFGIGMPPKICTMRKDRSGTEFTLNRIPLGGFCSLEGDSPDTFHTQDGIVMAKLRKKLLIILGGVIMNLIAAWIIFTFLFRHGTQPLGISNEQSSQSYLIPSLNFLQEKGFITGDIASGVIIQEITENSLAQKIELEIGHIILQVNGDDIDYSTLATTLEKYTNQDNILTLQNHEGIIEEKSFTCGEECKLGVTIIPNSTLEILPIKFGLGTTILAGLHEIKAERNLTFKALGRLGKGLFSFERGKFIEATKSLAGPVGAVKMGEMFYQIGGRIAYLAFAGIISVALAIFNLLPIPALDGGRGIGVILQALFKIKPERYFKYEGYVNAFFFYLLLLLGIIIIFKDLSFFWGMKIPFIG